MPSHFDLKNAIWYHTKTICIFLSLKDFPSKMPEQNSVVQNRNFTFFLIRKPLLHALLNNKTHVVKWPLEKLNVSQKNRAIHFQAPALLTVYLRHLLYPLQQTGDQILGCWLSGTLESGPEHILLPPSPGKQTSLLLQAPPLPLLIHASEKTSSIKHSTDQKSWFYTN